MVAHRNWQYQLGIINSQCLNVCGLMRLDGGMGKILTRYRLVG